MCAASPARNTRPGPVVRHHPLVDPERRQPDRVGDGDAAGAAPVDQRLHLGQRRHGPAGGVGGGDVGDDPVAAGRDREQGQHAIAVPVHVQLAGRRLEARQMDVGQHPVAGQRVALELHADAMPHAAVRPIAADQPVGEDGFLATVGVVQLDGDPASLRLEAGQLDPALDLDPKAAQVRLQQALGLALRQHQRVGMGGVDRVETDMRDPPGAGGDVDRDHLAASGSERSAAAHAVEQLERAAPHHQRLRLVRALGRLVDDADRHPVACELGRHGQSHRAGTHHEHACLHLHASIRPARRRGGYHDRCRVAERRQGRQCTAGWGPAGGRRDLASA